MVKERNGSICNLNLKGFGFIRPRGHTGNESNAFFPVKSLKGIKFEALELDMKVCYVEERTPKGLHASEVSLDYFAYATDDNYKKK